MQLTVVTPEKTILLKVEVEELLVPGERGEIGILPGHAPLISTLGAGVLKYRLAKSTHFEEVAVGWGYCETQADKVVVLAESAETKKELDKDQAQKDLNHILKQMEEPGLPPAQMRKLQKDEQTKRAFLKLLEKE